MLELFVAIAIGDKADGPFYHRVVTSLQSVASSSLFQMHAGLDLLQSMARNVLKRSSSFDRILRELSVARCEMLCLVHACLKMKPHAMMTAAQCQSLIEAVTAPHPLAPTLAVAEASLPLFGRTLESTVASMRGEVLPGLLCEQGMMSAPTMRSLLQTTTSDCPFKQSFLHGLSAKGLEHFFEALLALLLDPSAADVMPKGVHCMQSLLVDDKVEEQVDPTWLWRACLLFAACQAVPLAAVASTATSTSEEEQKQKKKKKKESRKEKTMSNGEVADLSTLQHRLLKQLMADRSALSDGCYAVLKILKKDAGSDPTILRQAVQRVDAWRPVNDAQKSIGARLLQAASFAERIGYPALAAECISVLPAVQLSLLQQWAAGTCTMSWPTGLGHRSSEVARAIAAWLFRKELMGKAAYSEALMTMMMGALMAHDGKGPQAKILLEAILAQTSAYLFAGLNAAQAVQVYRFMLKETLRPLEDAGQIKERERLLSLTATLVLPPTALLLLLQEYRELFVPAPSTAHHATAATSKKRARNDTETATADHYGADRALAIKVFDQFMLWLPGMLRRTRGPEKVMPGLCRFLDTLHHAQHHHHHQASSSSAATASSLTRDGRHGAWERSDISFYQQILVQCVRDSVVSMDAVLSKQSTAAMSINSIVQTLRGSENAQMQNQCLRILAMVTQVQPHRMSETILPIFTFMGASVIRRDDDVSYELTNKTLDSVLAGLTKQASDAKETRKRFAEICRLLLDSFEHIPGHRRLHLFSKVASLISAKASTSDAALPHAVDGRVWLTWIVCGRCGDLANESKTCRALESLMAHILASTLR